MSTTKAPRPGEVSIRLPSRADAALHFIGRIRTPFASVTECPKNTREADAVATVEIDPRYAAGLEGVELFSHLVLLYWLDEARRDLIRQAPSHLTGPRGVFALRSPIRPNPIGLAVVELLAVAGTILRVRNIDCRDGTPLLDVKPYFPSTDSFPDARVAPRG
ncbi:MAG TPA: tRNA (N6-threonylcarbamoyladenosine(37)-N6)-methyltransferase TrmO [Hyphomicrobiaceae bacterium]|nr:tRNA (N6-threonylcarbamoyladenosine(37)-N6)-methyltransferase TrmO [Hyphomicrobiaceae bacterium]